MKENEFSIAFKGSIEDGEHLRLSDFVKQLDAIKTVLVHIDHSITKQNNQSAYYRVINLSHSSPVCVVLEAVPAANNNDNTIAILNKFFKGLQSIINGIFPDDYDHRIFESLKKVGKSRFITEIKFGYDNKDIFIPKNLAVKIDDLLGLDEIIEESMTGTLEMVDVHTRNKCRIYPVVGPKRIDCYFSPELLPTVIAGVNHYVNVKGKFKYKSRYPFPYAVEVTHIEIYPPENELPTLFDLQGIAPNATGEINSEDFVRGMRDNEW